MSLESFYGGRIGASFIIVYHFDGIDIPQDSQSDYKVKYLAVSGIQSVVVHNEETGEDTYKDEYIYVWENNNFVEKNQSNYKKYRWKATAIDGHNVYISTTAQKQVLDYSVEPAKVLKAEGMKQCFSKGGATTDKVNYGEYVIIDTPDKNNPDNGKVFRRGMNYQDTQYGGGEYIGQVVGPQGPAPEVTMDHYKTIQEDTTDTYYNKFTGEYQVDTFNDLIPGAEGNTTTFNDQIKWITATIQDQWGNMNRCVIGFKIPYLVLEFEGNSINPYDPDYRQGSAGNWSYHNLIAKDTGADGFNTSTNTWKHPFFEKWQVKVPPGIHGDNSTNIEVVHTKTKPLNMNDNKKVKYYKNEAMADTDYVGELEDSVDVLLENVEGRTETGELIWVDTLYENNSHYTPVYNPTANWCKIKINEYEYYVHEEDCYMDMIRYRETIFDNIPEGEFRYYYIGYKNDIQRITLSETGVLTAYYSAKPTPQNIDQILQWIYMDPNPDETTRTKGIEIDDYGTVKVNYNTMDDNGNRKFDKFPNQLQWIKDIQLDEKGTVTITYNVPPDPMHPTERLTKTFDKVIDWITDVSLSKEGKLRIVFNNETIGELPPTDPADPWYDPDPSHANKGQYMTELQWIAEAEVTDDGIIKFFTNNKPNDPHYVSTLRLKIIDDMEIQTMNNSEYEGTGDQKIHVTYNTTHEIPDPTDPTAQATITEKDTDIIGNPLNYIIETAISMPSDEYPTVPYSHLLVYYSDPALRQKLGGKISYPSSKVQDYNPSTGEYTPHVWTEWVDLGDVRGSQNGIHIITNVANWDELKEDGHWIPPEQLKDESGQIIVPNGAGWNVTLTTGNGIDLLAFDYQTEEWYSIGSISNDFIDPRKIVTVSAANENHMPDPSDIGSLLNNGLWFATEVHRYAY